MKNEQMVIDLSSYKNMNEFDEELISKKQDIRENDISTYLYDDRDNSWYEIEEKFRHLLFYPLVKIGVTVKFERVTWQEEIDLLNNSFGL